MHKIAVVVLGLVASVTAIAVPGLRSDGDLPMNLEIRGHTQGHSETGKGNETKVAPLPDSYECGTTVFIPVIVSNGETSWEGGYSTTVTVTSYVIASSLTTAKNATVPTVGVSITHPVIITTGPVSANVTKPAKTGVTVGTAVVPNVTPSVHSLPVPSLGLKSSLISASTGSSGVPRISTLAGSYSLPKTSTLAGSYSLPQTSTLTGSNGRPTPSLLFLQGHRHTTTGTVIASATATPGAAAKERIEVGLLCAIFVGIAGSLVFLF